MENNIMINPKDYLVSVHNVRLLRYARQKNAHLPHVNSAFFDFASLASEHYDPDTYFIDGLYLQKGYGIGADNLVQGKQLSPKFNDLKEPGTFINHVENLKKNPDAVPNSEILHKLIENIEPLDFEIKAFPEAKDIYNTPIEKGIGPNPEYTGKYSRIIT